jgi:hypothetical protein
MHRRRRRSCPAGPISELLKALQGLPQAGFARLRVSVRREMLAAAQMRPAVREQPWQAQRLELALHALGFGLKTEWT